MGGESKSTTTQQSQTAPWEAAQPTLQGILGQVQTGLGNTGLTGAETGAINSVEANAAKGNPYAPQIGQYATDLFNGGGATNQAGAVNQNYQDYLKATNPLANNTNYDPRSTPGFSDAINGMTADITNNVNGTFAGAGRDFSGANSMALGRGLATGLAPVYQDQYNKNVQQQQAAAAARYGAGNTNAGILSGFQQQALANRGQGAGAADTALTAGKYGENEILQAEAARRGIPVSALGLLAQIGIPIAGLGSQSSGNSNTTNQASGAQQFGQIAGGVGSLFHAFMPEGL